MFIDKKSPIPAYYQLKSIILKKIETGEYGPRDPIPSERELGDMLGISRMTVRQGLNQLVGEGVLYREKGRGTFVSKLRIEQRNIDSFSSMVTKKGLVPVTRILHFERRKPTPADCGALGLGEGDGLYDIRRLRLAGDEPVGIEHVAIPEKYCPGLEKHDLCGSLYRVIREEYAHDISYADYVIEAVRPSTEEKKLLAITGNTPLLRTSGVTYTQSGLKLFSETSTYRSDEYKYRALVHVNGSHE